MGIVAQSIGGGGGFVTAAGANLEATTVAGDPGANDGAGGPVSVTLNATGSITTSGAGAWGILAQSVGGGGGFAGDPSLPFASPSSNTLPRTGSGNAAGGTISLTVNGDILTTGANAHGIFAQSIGGSGGIAAGCCDSPTAYLIAGNTAQLRGTSNATYSGDGGAIAITQGTGSVIKTSGSGSIGIVAQSSGNSSGGGDINVSLGGTVIGGTNAGVTEGVGAAGILLNGGFTNTIAVNAGGSVGTMDGIAGTAIIANSGVTNVNNAGTITGGINLGSTPGTISNTGTLNTGAALVAATLSNSGLLAIGGPRSVATTALSGNLTQSGGGTLAVDINSIASGQKADLLTVTGNASLAGTVAPSALTLLPGALTILTAGDRLTLSAATPQPLVVNWNLAQSGNSATLSPSANFMPGGVSLTPSQASMANYLTGTWQAATVSLAPLFADLATIQTASQYANALNTASARGTQGQTTSFANDSARILGSALSCPVFVDQGTLLGEDDCAWARLVGEWTSQSASGGEAGYATSGAAYRIGLQHAVAPDWYLGGSFAVGQTWEHDDASTGHGATYDGAIALKHTMGPWLFAGSVALASGSFQNSRVLAFPATGFSPPIRAAALQSDPSLFMAGGRLRAAYDVPLGNAYVRPYGDLDVIYTNMPGFTESGDATYGLNVRSANRTNVSFSPMLEFGGRHDFGDGFILRPFAAVGLSVASNNTRAVDASFLGATAGAATFRTYIKSPGLVGSFDVGLQLYRNAGLEVKAEYTARVGEAYLSQEAVGRIAYHF
jgi:hypothetical protein